MYAPGVDVIARLRIEIPEGTEIPETWPELRRVLDDLPADTTRVELLDVRED